MSLIFVIFTKYKIFQKRTERDLIPFLLMLILMLIEVNFDLLLIIEVIEAILILFYIFKVDLILNILWW